MSEFIGIIKACRVVFIIFWATFVCLLYINTVENNKKCSKHENEVKYRSLLMLKISNRGDNVDLLITDI